VCSSDLGSTWVAPDGSEGVAFTNMSDKPVTLVFKLDLASWTNGATFKPIAGDTTIPTITPGSDGWCKTVFPPGYMAVLANRQPKPVPLSPLQR